MFRFIFTTPQALFWTDNLNEAYNYAEAQFGLPDNMTGSDIEFLAHCLGVATNLYTDFSRNRIVEVWSGVAFDNTPISLHIQSLENFD